ncbi:uncharacterized protein LOC134844099 [Symsagittifera roscoffensis]|uniref:uncharacterized protein LOC134844099 n=1 Tax=Symsagittifera roscoffensis TaxID=84072 RepID=UPI00307BCF7B
MERRTVVITVDGSPHSQRAFEWYVKHLMRPGVDVVYLIHIAEQVSLPMMSADAPLSFPKDAWVEKLTARTKMIEEIRDHYEAKLQEYKLHQSGKGGFISENANSAFPGPQLVEFIQNKKAEIVVMGNRGLGKLKRTFLGSVSDYVLHNSGVAVMIVPPTADRFVQ